ncbi:MAG: hypothetical protein PHR06_04755 [Candidatus Cloacimonetes bacterium]|nr:hypothetical protein [Candidatus Cloacimonadota bacterium]
MENEVKQINQMNKNRFVENQNIYRKESISSYIDKFSYDSLNLRLLSEKVLPISETGRIYAHSFKPFLCGEKEELIKEFSRVKRFSTALKNEPSTQIQLIDNLKHIKNISMILDKLRNSQILEIFEIQEVKNFLFFYQKVFNLFDKNLSKELFCLNNLENLFDFLDPENQKIPSFYISSAYSEEIRNLRELLAKLSNRKKLLVKQQLQEAKESLELTSIEKEIVVSRYNPLKEKLLNSAFFSVVSENFANITFQLRENERILELSKSINETLIQINEEEKKIRLIISRHLESEHEKLSLAHSETGRMDFYLTRAIFYNDHLCCIPEFISDNTVDIINARNLPVEWELKKHDVPYQKIDIISDKQINILQGANMAGKTTILKTLGQIFYLAAHLVPVPASVCRIPLLDRIFYSGQSSQTDRMDLSSFGYEVVSISKALGNNSKSLFLIDEFARGTNPEEGTAFSFAIFNSFTSREDILFAATHFTIPTGIINCNRFRIKGIASSLQKSVLSASISLNDRIKTIHKYMDYSLEKVEENCEPPKSALLIAELLGVDSDIVETANDILNKNKRNRKNNDNLKSK